MSGEPEEDDEPEAASWWLRSLSDAQREVSRREALGQLLAALAVGTAASGCDPAFWNTEPDYEEEHERALVAQQRFGWDVGARNLALEYGPAMVSVLPPEALQNLLADLTPTLWRHVHTSTLFEALDAVPLEFLEEEPLSFRPLPGALRLLETPAMQRAHAIAAVLLGLFQGCPLETALVVDLPGPESVAFAAALASLFEPVFGLANWPHPLGQVPAHLALTAVAVYQNEFRAARQRRPTNAPPCLVLDRLRLSAPLGEEDHFDNRYLASVPSPETLRAGGIQHVLYLVPDAGSLPELEDLNEDLVALVAAGIDVRALGLDAFLQPVAAGPYCYGLAPEETVGFWAHYPWCGAPQNLPAATVNPVYRTWTPTPRATLFSRHHTPPGFGEVVLMTREGRVRHPRFDRRGSWHRWRRSGG